ncbi:PREDICTED: cGMP-specific 3',5'-cyclic phosphodiesterase-like isoform X2 [Amphimedon queenslandica]|uniref:Phosphodiesterase n=1 Tax=Amphimedon queenslandica TaxID=400682 RepID=A0A1X7V3C4_AMPQE|nr:PREDICTED: cGMP-specific 3',5'-cyclic phosphodiesterase-like isoform X2 [Amphimedon queenslandica]|eukprot:XP_019850838.1 PREDICTED: cGMP-specific 3',5'-cyclic phosphodiesterase-like isoform X2 [Amphimedon queenslandica]
MSKLNRKSVSEWLDSNEEIGKEIVANFLMKRPVFWKEMVEQQTHHTVASRRLTLHRLSIAGAPGPLLPFAGDCEGITSSGVNMKRFTSGPIMIPKKSKDQLRKLNKQDLFMELLKDVISPEFDVYSLSHKILVNVLLLIDGDRSSLFFVEGSKENPILISRLFDVTAHSQLESVLHDDSEAIKIPFGVGIVGQVAKTGELINLKDAYDSPYFNKEIDKLTGYRTKALLCMPIKTSSGEVIGVAQVMNKHNDGEFTEEDVEVFNTYMTFCAIGLTNSHLFELSFTHSRRLQMLLELTKKLFEDTTSMEEMIECIMSEALKLIPCEKCIVVVVDKKTENDVTFKIAIQFNGKETETLTTIDPEHIDGYDVIIKVAQTCEQIITNDDGAQQSKTTLSISSNSNMLCMPVFNDKGDLMAIVKLDNKLNGLPFNDMEQESFQVFSMYCGLAIHNVLNYEKIKRANAKQTVALEVLSYHAAASLDETERLMSMSIQNIKDAELVSFTFDDLKFTDDETVLASVLMFKEMGFTHRFHIDDKSLFRWVLTVRKNYRPVLYHNWRHAFNVAQAMFTIMSGRIGCQFTDIEKLSLLIACFSHDLDHRGTNNAFQSKIESPLAQLYTTSTMEHHHFNHCIMILNCDSNKLLQNVSSETYEKIIRVIEDAILSTDLSLYFKNRSKFFDMINSGEFDSSDVIHRDLMRGMLMTACDVAAVSKPWRIQRRVADLVMKEFFQQGDMERENLNMTPVAIMDRRKIDELPQMQAGFIKGVCLPLYKVLAKFSPEFLPMADGAQFNLNGWEERIKSPGHGSISVSHRSMSITPSITESTPIPASATSTVNQRLGLIEAWVDHTQDERNTTRRNRKCNVL